MKTITNKEFTKKVKALQKKDKDGVLYVPKTGVNVTPGSPTIIYYEHKGHRYEYIYKEE